MQERKLYRQLMGLREPWAVTKVKIDFVVLSDLDNPRVLDVARDRKEEYLGELLNKLAQAERDSIEAVAQDTWEPFINAVEQYLPQADIVHDKFHIAKYLGEAVDKVRRAKNRSLVKAEDDTLKGTKYLWLINPNNWTEQQEASFSELKDKGLKVGRAWSIKRCFQSSGNTATRRRRASSSNSGFAELPMHG
jgi:transposase